MSRKIAARSYSGFTLIELVVVLAILAAIAGLVGPQIDSLRRSSDKGTASHTIATVSQNTQLYRTLKGNYPPRFDSLVQTSGTALYTKLSSKITVAMTTATVVAGAGTVADPNYLKSLADVGITQLMYHDESLAPNFSQNLPVNSGNTETTLTNTSTVATLVNPPVTSKGRNMVGSIYPDGIPAGVLIVLVGVGQNTTFIGQTIANTTYNRYVLAFAAYATGKRAQLIGSFDSTGDFLTQAIDEYNENAVE
jgi:prepilin-type N-terminal cleavage/methylation domain-containing protein